MSGVFTQLFGRPATVPVGTFLPTDLGAALRIWYNLDNQSETNGAGISTLVDYSGNGFNGSVAGASHPTMLFSAIGGKKAAQFVNNDGFTFAAPGTVMSGATAASYFGVVKRGTDPAGTSNDGGPILANYKNTTNPSAWPWTDGIIYESFGSNSQRSTGNPTPSLTSPRIYSCHATTNDVRTYLDGTNFYTSASNTFGLQSASGRIGDSGTGSLFRGSIAEVLLFNSVLTTSDRQKVEGYLAWRYGLNGNLPVGHPYLSAPP